MQSNGFFLEPFYGNSELTIFPSAARSGTINSADFKNYSSSSAIFFFDITAVPGVSDLTLIAQAKDPVSGNYINMTNIVPMSAIGTYFLFVNAITNTPLSRTFRVRIVQNGAGVFTYSVGCSLQGG